MPDSSATTDTKRADRLYPPLPSSPTVTERRSEFERDRDRLLYCPALRRLALITQVVSPEEGSAFHNRLTHVIKVAQVGKHLAEKLLADHEKEPELITALGGLDPAVVEAAAYAHDLGHPPFGHLAEYELNRKATGVEEMDGFEGNAQSFRIVCSLEIRDAHNSRPGLNLTRASLNAILKYPNFRETSGPQSKKWGAYSTEKTDFNFARESGFTCSKSQCLEAAIMDWADDIAYSLHDVDDFYRANRIPLWKLVTKDDERASLVDAMVKRRGYPKEKISFYTSVADKLFGGLPINEPFSGSRLEIGAMRVFISERIREFEEQTKLSTTGLEVGAESRAKVEILKELVWQYVILNPNLAIKQHGQKRIIGELFDIYRDDATESAPKLFPLRFQEQLRASSKLHTRTVLDFISSLTEPQAIQLHRRLTGIDIDSCSDDF